MPLFPWSRQEKETDEEEWAEEDYQQNDDPYDIQGSLSVIEDVDEEDYSESQNTENSQVQSFLMQQQEQYYQASSYPKEVEESASEGYQQTYEARETSSENDQPRQPAFESENHEGEQEETLEWDSVPQNDNVDDSQRRVSFADHEEVLGLESDLAAQESPPSSPPEIPRRSNEPTDGIVAPAPTISDENGAAATTTTTTLSKPFAHKFTFLSEEESVPSQLHQLQETSLRRRHEFQSNIYDLERRVAALTASLTRERMERDESLNNLLPDHVYKPLQDAMEDLSLQRTAHSGQHWSQLAARLSVLDSHMTHSRHVDLEDAKLNQLDRLRDRIEQEVEPTIQVEAHKMDKREGSLVRKFEELAGNMARRYQEECAVRGASAKMVSSQVKTMQALDEASANAFVGQCQAVRKQIDDEKEARSREDARISNMVVKQETLMKEALLEAVGGSV